MAHALCRNIFRYFRLWVSVHVIFADGTKEEEEEVGEEGRNEHDLKELNKLLLANFADNFSRKCSDHFMRCNVHNNARVYGKCDKNARAFLEKLMTLLLGKYVRWLRQIQSQRSQWACRDIEASRNRRPQKFKIACAPSECSIRGSLVTLGPF